MASTTTNYGLTKPAYSDTADIATQNTNMDKIDTALGGLDAGIAIVANGNTHAAISEGQYVYIRGHNSLAEGLYSATANIAANGTLSGTNVTSAVMGTALAALSGSTVKYTDVINSLTSTETSKPLSAAKGKELSDHLNSIHHLDRQTDANAVHNNASANTFYRTVMSANSSNMPNTHAFWLEGNKISESYGIQDAVDTETGYQYSRYRWGMEQWTNWVCLAPIAAEC